MLKITPIVFSLMLASSVTGQVIMINFGSTEVPVGQATYSPLHTEMPSYTGSTWNEAGNGDLASITLANGTAGTGLSMDIGSSTNGPVVDYSANPASSNTLTGSTALSDFYKDTVSMASVTWNGGFASDNRYVGIRVDGLAAGEYTIYLWGTNGNIGTNPVNAYASAGASAGTFSFAGVSPEVIANTESADDWIDTVTFSEQTVTLAAGESIYLAVDGVNSGQSRGFLSGAQIVGVIPEPQTYALVLGLAVIALGLRRRK